MTSTFKHQRAFNTRLDIFDIHIKNIGLSIECPLSLKKDCHSRPSVIPQNQRRLIRIVLNLWECR